MTRTNIPCERDGPSCAEWLLGESDQEPDHICSPVMAWSIERFIERRAHGAWQDAFGGYWPLPVGAKSIAEWPTSPNRCVVLWALRDFERWDGEYLFAVAQPNPAIEIPAWYTPLVTKPDAYAGLVAERHIDGMGSVWLLGLVERDIDAPFWWRWAQPVTLVEAQTSKATDLDTLNEKARTLLDWYSARLLGISFKIGPGRPLGSKEYWRDKEDFVSTVRAAIKAIQGQGRAVTQEQVFEYLSGRIETVPRPHAQGGYSLRQFQRDRKDYGFASWVELRDFCTS